MKLVSKTLTSQARDKILDIINDKSEFMSKLPSEKELSLMLGVSRNTVREALRSLENEGIVAPRHGIGTFVIRNTKNIKSNLAILDSFTEIIKNHGHIPGTKSISYDKRKAGIDIGEKLNIDANSDILYIDRVRTADGEPVIYINDYITHMDGMYEGFKNSENESLFDFLEAYNIKMSFSSCNIYAIISNKRIQEKLCLKKPEALLYLQQIHYCTKGLPVMYSDSYFLSTKFDFNLIRKVIS